MLLGQQDAKPIWAPSDPQSMLAPTLQEASLRAGLGRREGSSNWACGQEQLVMSRKCLLARGQEGGRRDPVGCRIDSLAPTERKCPTRKSKGLELLLSSLAPMLMLTSFHKLLWQPAGGGFVEEGGALCLGTGTTAAAASGGGGRKRPTPAFAAVGLASFNSRLTTKHNPDFAFGSEWKK